MTLLDDAFLAMALALLVWSRFSTIRARRLLRSNIRALRTAASAWQSTGGDLRAIAEIAARLHHIEKGSAELLNDGRRRLRVRLRGRVGRLDLIDNFFLRNPLMASEIDAWLRDMEAVCTRAIADDLRAYRSPLNPFNAPSSLFRFLGSDPPRALEYGVDAMCWTLLGATAALIVSGSWPWA